jgi:two-component system, OmpR family, sensor histidine kinase CiaH
MFQSARIKLTVWYLLIIMLVSLLFSIAFYNVSSREIERITRRNQVRLMLIPFDPNLPPTLGIDDLQEVQQRLQLLLILINISIFFGAGISGYFLAGRNLLPIKEMVDEQNRFITDASHELRTPLTALRSEMEAVLLEKHLNEIQAKKLVASNLEEVINLQSLSDNLLQLTQFQKHNNNKLFLEISLLSIIEDSLKKITPLAKKKQITINNNIDDAIIKANSHDLGELFVILLDNAIKYSPKNSKIALKSKKIDHQIIITISDQGIGIDNKDLIHIFDRFYRADASRTKTLANGYGLGLAIAKKIVDEHKGKISVKSEVNRGSEFIIQLPIV